MHGENEITMKSVKTTFDILEYLVQSGPASLTEISNELDIPTSTIHDHLQTLHQLHFITKDKEYRASMRLLDFGMLSRKQNPLYNVCKPEIESIANETGDHALVMTEEHGLGVILAIERGKKSVQFEPHAGTRMWLHGSAIGKCIAAHLSEDRLEDIVENYGLPPLTSQTVTDPDKLHDHLTQVREDGYYVGGAGEVEEMRSIGTPIRTNGILHGAIGIVAPLYRMREDRQSDLQDILFESKNRIELNLKHGSSAY